MTDSDDGSVLADGGRQECSQFLFPRSLQFRSSLQLGSIMILKWPSALPLTENRRVPPITPTEIDVTKDYWLNE